MVTTPPEEPQAFDAVVALDNSVKKRLGTVIPAIKDGALWINIDHHVSNDRYGDLNYIDPSAPATGQILCEFFRDPPHRITPDQAANLYAAISTDTGSFQYAGTGPRTFQPGRDGARRRRSECPRKSRVTCTRTSPAADSSCCAMR